MRSVPVRPLVLVLLVAACAQPASLGPGAPDAEPGMRAVESTGRTGLRVLGLTGQSLACSGTYEAPTAFSPVRSTELACSGGVTGTATVGPDLSGGRSVRWQLETGESGRAVL